MFDKNVPLGVRRLLPGHAVRTYPEVQWDPQLEYGELLKAGEAAGFDVLVTSEQNIKDQQNLSGRKLCLMVLGSNIWPIVGEHVVSIKAVTDPGSRRRSKGGAEKELLGWAERLGRATRC